MVTISNATAVEGKNKYLEFNLTLDESLPFDELLSLKLNAVDGSATGGRPNKFENKKKALDFANRNFEFSVDDGNTWLPATKDIVTFAFGRQTMKVRLAVNDDDLAEGYTPETMELQVDKIVKGKGSNEDITDIGTGFIEDNDNPDPPIDVLISDTTVTELEDDYITWNVGLSAPSDEPIVLELETDELTALGGSKKDVRKALKDEFKAVKDLLKQEKKNNKFKDLKKETKNELKAAKNEEEYKALKKELAKEDRKELKALQKELKSKLKNIEYVDFVSNEFEVSTDGGKTWQAAAAGNQLSFEAGHQNSQIRTLLTDDVQEESTQSLNLSVANVSMGSVDSFSAVGTASIVDNDTADASTTRYQAEDATFVGPQVFSGRGADGTGYVDYQNFTDDYIEWEVNAPHTGTYDLSWRYALGNNDRPLKLTVNGDVEAASLNFTDTGNWTNWKTVDTSVDLDQGINTIRLTAIGSSGANFDWLELIGPTQIPDSAIPISLLPATEVRVEGDQTFSFDGTDGGMGDKDGEDIGFTMVDPASNPGNPNPEAGIVGYWADKLNVENGVLKITTTPGIQFDDNNSQDNALGVGLNLPSKNLELQTTLVDLPAAAGGYAQAGLWFGQAEEGGLGSSEDDYIKLAVLSTASGDYQLEALMEQDGVIIQKQRVDIPNSPASVSLSLFANADNQTVTAQYSLVDGSTQNIAAFTAVPQEWFSFDQAGINPDIATRSFGGVFATQRNASASQVFSFADFTIKEGGIVSPPITGDLPFDRWSIPVARSTAMDVGPDGRLYVATVTGQIHALTIDPDTRTYTDEVINTITEKEGGPRLALGIAVDPDSTPDNVTLWVSHSDGSQDNGKFNSGKVSRLSGSGFSRKNDVITGLPRAIANHATNNIDFGPDGRLYIWQGGNTGAGSANLATTEFGDRPEQVLAAALLVADVKDPHFNGNAAAIEGEFVDEFYNRTGSGVEIYATGLRNTYDGVFHSNGQLYAPDNGLGVTGTVPPVPRLGDATDRSITTKMGDVSKDNPGKQNDPLNRIEEGGYYGHPNPYRDEVIFKDGKFQKFDATNTPSDHSEYEKQFADLGTNKSANGIIEYTADNFFGTMQGDLLITNFSRGDDLTRLELSPDGLSAAKSSSLIDGFTDPLPIAMGANGSIFVGEFNGDRITVLEPLGIWRQDLPSVPISLLDAGSAVSDGKLYLVGGKTASTHIDNMYIYDPGDPLDATDDTWTTGPDLPGVAVENPAVASFDGKLYVFGGSTAPFSGAVKNAAVFDPQSSTWTTLANMPTARGGATAQVLDDKIYVIGGLNSQGSSLKSVEVFDPLTGQWQSETPLQTRRDNAGSAVVDDLLYVFGGRTRNSNGSVVDGTINTVEIYDPNTDLWSYGPSMPTGRRAMSVGTLNGRIQVIGGEDGPNGTAFDLNEEYNPATGDWRVLPSIATPRHGAAFGTIDDVIYVAGGGSSAGSSFTAVTEAFTL